MVYRENLTSVKSHVHGSLIFQRQPKIPDFLIAPHEVSLIYPHRQLFGRMPHNLHDGVVLGVNPHFPIEEILVLSRRSSLHDEAAVSAEILLAKQGKGVICST